MNGWYFVAKSLAYQVPPGASESGGQHVGQCVVLVNGPGDHHDVGAGKIGIRRRDRFDRLRGRSQSGWERDVQAGPHEFRGQEGRLGGEIEIRGPDPP